VWTGTSRPLPRLYGSCLCCLRAQEVAPRSHAELRSPMSSPVGSSQDSDHPENAGLAWPPAALGALLGFEAQSRSSGSPVTSSLGWHHLSPQPRQVPHLSPVTWPPVGDPAPPCRLPCPLCLSIPAPGQAAPAKVSLSDALPAALEMPSCNKAPAPSLRLSFQDVPADQTDESLRFLQK